MKFFSKGKDGGPESTVTGYWLLEIKSLFSIVLLKFDGHSREAFHEHAFNSVSWLLQGQLNEYHRIENNPHLKIMMPHYPSWLPISTWKKTCHKVDSVGVSWVISFRGPWSKIWKEYNFLTGEQTTLTYGRTVLNKVD